jgi:hypothetical protein
MVYTFHTPIHFGRTRRQYKQTDILFLTGLLKFSHELAAPSTCTALTWKGIRSRTVSRNRLPFLAVARLHACSTSQRRYCSRNSNTVSISSTLHLTVRNRLGLRLLSSKPRVPLSLIRFRQRYSVALLIPNFTLARHALHPASLSACQANNVFRRHLACGDNFVGLYLTS